MAVKFVEKAKKKDKDAGTLVPTSLQKLLLEYGEVCDEVALMKPLLDKKSELEKEIREEVKGLGADPSQQIDVIYGGFHMIISKVPNVRTVTDVQYVHGVLGEGFYDVVKVPLKAVDDYLTPEQKQSCLIIEQKGTRRIAIEHYGDDKHSSVPEEGEVKFVDLSDEL